MERQTAGVVDIILYPSQVKQNTHISDFLNFAFGKKRAKFTFKQSCTFGCIAQIQKCSIVIKKN